jgi:hypothetical protein
MQSTRQLTTDMVFLFCALGVCSAAFQAKPSTQEKKTENTYKRTITIGETSYDMNGTCLYFAAFMTSDDFFDGLRAINDSSGRRFFKGTKELKQFPDELTIQIKALGAECSKGRLIRPTNSESPMRSLKFRLKWKDGLRERSANSSQVKVYPPSSTDTVNDGNSIWLYELTVNSNEIPLTDHLVLEILLGEDKLLGRMSAQL